MTIQIKHLNPERAENRSYILTSYVYNDLPEKSSGSYRDIVISFFMLARLYDNYLFNQGNFEDLVYDFVKNLLGYTNLSETLLNPETHESNANESFTGIHDSHPLANASEQMYLKQVLCFLARLSTKARKLIIKYLTQLPEQNVNGLLLEENLTVSYESEKSQKLFYHYAKQYYNLVLNNPSIAQNIRKLPSQTITFSCFSKKNGEIIFNAPMVNQFYEILNKKFITDSNRDHATFFNNITSFFGADFIIPPDSSEPAIHQLNNAALNFITGLIADLNDPNQKHPLKSYKNDKEVSKTLYTLLGFFRKYYPKTAQLINEFSVDFFSKEKIYQKIVMTFSFDQNSTSEGYISGRFNCSIPINDASPTAEDDNQIGLHRYLLTNAIQNGQLPLENIAPKLHQLFSSYTQNYVKAVFIYFSPVHIFAFDFMEEATSAATQARVFIEYVLQNINLMGFEKFKEKFSDLRDFFLSLYPNMRDMFYTCNIHYTIDNSLHIMHDTTDSEISNSTRVFERPLTLGKKLSSATYTYECEFSREANIGGLKATRYSQQKEYYHHDETDRNYLELHRAFLTNLSEDGKVKYFRRVINYFSLKQHERKYHPKVKREVVNFVQGLIADTANYCRTPTGLFFRTEMGFTRSYMDLLLSLAHIQGDAKSSPASPTLKTIILEHLQQNSDNRTFVSYGKSSLFFSYKYSKHISNSLFENDWNTEITLQADPTNGRLSLQTHPRLRRV